ncbi:hypothetical protein F8M41_003199 [Gigaspora margarita]|uniref:Restriction endonuclease type IV Mrr domain-containing protein n=1 Tax=Gigaspora margarita TaxID=4874 RepID=A0A8H4AY88_GIGMA|nr:hypothetical protein F8M41_003199 [Gigaspora margarita]
MPYLRYVVGDFIVEEFEEEKSTSDKGKSLEYKVERFLKSKGVNCIVSGNPNDGGFDIIGDIYWIPFIMQCKKWITQQIGRPTIDELKGVISTLGSMTIGIVVSYAKIRYNFKLRR